MINYYEYETSPRKINPEYEENNNKIKRTKTKTRKKVNVKKNKAVEYSRKRTKYIIEIAVAFVILLTISYRYSLINTKFSEKESLKTELAEIQKQNAQLQLNIEKGTNINNVEQQAKEKLGMKKLDNSQKVYISLPKEDYVESGTEEIEKEDDETWWEALINDLLGK